MKNTLLALLFISASYSTFAQEEKVIYVHSNRSLRKQKEYKTVDFYNAYKFDVMQMAAGQILFAYERRVSDKGSLEFELGPNLSNVGINIGHYGGNASSQSMLGVSTSIGFRYYPNDDKSAFNGFYVGPKFEFKNYNYLYQAYGNMGEPVGESYRGYSNMYRFMFNMGKQYWISSTFSLDIYAGLGLGNISGKAMNVYYQYNSQTMEYENVVQKSTFSDASVMFECGIKCGIGN